METGQFIREFRIQKNLTQKELGALCNPPIAESTIRRYELGKLNPKLETLQKISTALEVPLQEFYIESIQPNTQNEQLHRLMYYYSKLNSQGLNKMEQLLIELLQDDQYLK